MRIAVAISRPASRESSSDLAASDRDAVLRGRRPRLEPPEAAGNKATVLPPSIAARDQRRPVSSRLENLTEPRNTPGCEEKTRHGHKYDRSGSASGCWFARTSG